MDLTPFDHERDLDTVDELLTDIAREEKEYDRLWRDSAPKDDQQEDE